MIEVKNLKKVYADGTVALRGVNLKLDKSVTGVLGRNGAGKTTMIRIMSTQLTPSSGTVTIMGHDVIKDTSVVRENILSIPQEAKTQGISTPMEHCVMYLTARGMGIAEARKKALHALEKVDMLKEKDKPCDELSGGMKQKVFVAMALAANANVVFLDEPTIGLDPISRLEVWAAIRELKSQIVITTHYIEEAKALADEIVMVDNGKVIGQGTVASLLKPLAGKVRIEGVGDYRIGELHISYMPKAKAHAMIEKGYAVRPVGLEDLFILHGVKLED